MEKESITGRSRAQVLLRRVAARQRMVSLGARAYLFLLILTGAYAALLVFSRFSGVIGDWYELEVLAALPAVALTLGLILRHSPGAAQAARLVDTRSGTDDLFLTTALIEKCAGEYKPLVLSEAEQRAGSIEARRVVPYQWLPKGTNAVVVMAVLLAGALFLPQFDPFGKNEERQRVVRRFKRLKDSGKATKLRADILKKKGKAAHSKEVKQALAELKKTFKQMKPTQKKANLKKRLQPAQGELGKLWRKKSEEKLKDAFARTTANQRFGRLGDKEFSKWKRELEQGDISSLKKELNRLERLTREFSETSDPLEREKLRQQIEEGLAKLADFSMQELNSKPINSALARALEQLDSFG